MASHVANGSAVRFWMRIVVGIVAAGLMLHSSVGWAGPQEQYDEGFRAYQAGDVGGAMKLLQPPADAGHVPSQVLLADILEKAGFFEESVAYFRRAAQTGDARGEYGLALAHASGKGAAHDPDEARRQMTQAASRGHAGAVAALAQAWMTGGLGIKPADVPDKEGQAWIHEAARAGYLPAIDFLAAAYRSGRIGPADLKLAEQYEAQAEKLRYPDGRPRVRRRN